MVQVGSEAGPSEEFSGPSYFLASVQVVYVVWVDTDAELRSAEFSRGAYLDG